MRMKFSLKPKLCMMKRYGQYFVYILKCRNGTFYTGYTSNIEQRIKLHNKGTGAKYLRGKGPVELVFMKQYKYYKCALNRERSIKKLTRLKKEKLIRCMNKVSKVL